MMKILQFIVPALVSFFSFVWEQIDESYIGPFIEDWIIFMKRVIKSHSFFNRVGLFAVYPLVIAVSFVLSLMVLLVISAIIIVIGLLEGFVHILLSLIFYIAVKDVSSSPQNTES